MKCYIICTNGISQFPAERIHGQQLLNWLSIHPISNHFLPWRSSISYHPSLSNQAEFHFIKQVRICHPKIEIIDQSLLEKICTFSAFYLLVTSISYCTWCSPLSMSIKLIQPERWIMAIRDTTLVSTGWEMGNSYWINYDNPPIFAIFDRWRSSISYSPLFLSSIIPRRQEGKNLPPFQC